MLSDPATGFLRVGWPLAGLGIGGIVVLACLHHFNLAESLRLPLYSSVQRWATAGAEVDSNVVLLEMPATKTQEEEEVSRLLTVLREGGASLVAFNELPDFSEKFYQNCVRENDVLFGQPLVRSPAVANSFQLIPKPEAARNLPEKSLGITFIPQPEFGPAYAQQALSNIDYGPRLGLEALVAIQLGIDQPSTENYWIDFLGRDWQLPVIYADQVQAGNLSGLIKGKVVLIGRGKHLQETGIVTFKSPSITGDTLSLLEFQGYALNSLLTKRSIRPLSVSWAVLILALLVYASFAAAQWLTARRLLVYSFLTAGGLVGLACCYLAFGHVWIPLTESMVALLAGAVVGRWHHSVKREDTVAAVTAGLSQHLQPFSDREQSYTPRNHWEQVRELLDHLIECQQVAFFELDTDGRTLLEQENNDPLLVTELDAQIEPFLSSVKAGGTIEVHEFFELKEETPSFLTPLTFGGSLLGFWACSMNLEERGEGAGTRGLLRDYAVQFSEVLYWSRLWSRGQEASKGLLRRLSDSDIGHQLPNKLEQAASYAQRWLTRFEDIFRADRTALALYDGFGRILMVNPAMRGQMIGLGLLPYKHTAQDFLLALFGEETKASVKTMLRCVLRDGDVIERHPTKLDASGRVYNLNMQLLSQAERDLPMEQGEKAMRREGMLVKLVDVTSRAKLSQVKLELLQRVSAQLLNDFMTIESALYLLQNKKVPKEKHERVVELMHGKLKECVTTLREVESPLRRELEVDFEERYPLDPRIPILSALDKVRNLADSRDIGVPDEASLPRFIKFLLGAPAQLEKLLGSILEFLIGDSRAGEHLEVELRDQRDGWISYRLRSHGYGMDQEKLATCLESGEERSSQDFGSIRSAIDSVKRWGGELDVRSELGGGFTFTLKLTAVY